MIKKGIKKEFNELILKMIISGSLLYFFVENVYFKKIIEHYTLMTPLNVLQLKDVESTLYLEKISVIKKILSDLISWEISKLEILIKIIKYSFLEEINLEILKS